MPKESFHSLTEQTYFKECLMIQDEGKQVCLQCSAHKTDKCNGINIIKTGKNKLGYKIPLKKY